MIENINYSSFLNIKYLDIDTEISQYDEENRRNKKEWT